MRQSGDGGEDDEDDNDEDDDKEGVIGSIPLQTGMI